MIVSHNCPVCGRFMHRTELASEDVYFDADLAAACGCTEDDIDTAENSNPGFVALRLSIFYFMDTVWECSACGELAEFADDPASDRRYYNPTTECFDAPLPETPAQRGKREARAAGQIEML